MNSAKVARKVLVPLQVYGVEIVKKAAYRFLDKASPQITVEGDNVACTFEFSPGISEAGADELLRNFHVELLDQDLRDRVSKETAPIRNAILALAFAPAKAQGE